MTGHAERLLGSGPERRTGVGMLRTYMWCGPCGRSHVPDCSFLMGGSQARTYDARQIELRDRIRALTPRLNDRERALFGLVWLQLDVLDVAGDSTAQWTLDVLSTLVEAFETAEAPASEEPP
jgi:hypothetical protein